MRLAGLRPRNSRLRTSAQGDGRAMNKTEQDPISRCRNACPIRLARFRPAGSLDHPARFSPATESPAPRSLRDSISRVRNKAGPGEASAAGVLCSLWLTLRRLPIAHVDNVDNVLWHGGGDPRQLALPIASCHALLRRDFR